jgi:hypothetical protein
MDEDDRDYSEEQEELEEDTGEEDEVQMVQLLSPDGRLITIPIALLHMLGGGLLGERNLGPMFDGERAVPEPAYVARGRL